MIAPPLTAKERYYLKRLDNLTLSVTEKNVFYQLEEHALDVMGEHALNVERDVNFQRLRAGFVRFILESR